MIAGGEVDNEAAEAALKVAAGPEFEHQRAKVEAAVTRIVVAAKR